MGPAMEKKHLRQRAQLMQRPWGRAERKIPARLSIQALWATGRMAVLLQGNREPWRMCEQRKGVM